MVNQLSVKDSCPERPAEVRDLSCWMSDPCFCKGGCLAFSFASLRKFSQPFASSVKNCQNSHFFLLDSVSDDKRRA
jgi:hypothetical protein